MRWALAAVLAATPACAAAGVAGAPPVGGAAGVDAPSAEAGTLRTDQVTVELRDAALLVRVTPLDEAVLRLTAADTQARLRALARAAERRERDGAPAAADAALFLVSFHGARPDVAFDPEALSIEAGGLRLRPTRIVPLTPGWGERRLDARTAESAIYGFDREVAVMQPFTVRYGAATSEAWREILPRLRAEEARSPARRPARTP